MAKKPVTITLSEETIAILKQIAAADDRSQAYVVDKLIKAEAARLSITPPKSDRARPK